MVKLDEGWRGGKVGWRMGRRGEMGGGWGGGKVGWRMERRGEMGGGWGVTINNAEVVAK